MTPLQHAAALAHRRLPVFRLKRGTKDVHVDADWATGGATVDPFSLHEKFGSGEYNIGVLATGFVIVDVDNHGKVNGFESLKALGLELPPTFTVRTPSGGLHLYFDAVGERYGQRDLAPGVNIRATNGYVVGPGSVVNGRPYVIECDAPVAPLPQALSTYLRVVAAREASAPKVIGDLDSADALSAARGYLDNIAPIAVEGSSGNNTTYAVACQVLDRGAGPEAALQLMLEHWNDQCAPPWDGDELERVVRNAAQYRQAAVGRDNPAGGLTPINIEALTVPDEASGITRWVANEPLTTEFPWLIDEVLFEKGTGFLAGASGSGKTFLLIHMALCGASGRAFFGRRIPKPFGTYIVAAEGAHSIVPRIQAAAVNGFGVPESDAQKLPVAYCTDVPNLLTEAGREVLIGEIKRADADMRRDYGVSSVL